MSQISQQQPQPHATRTASVARDRDVARNQGDSSLSKTTASEAPGSCPPKPDGNHCKTSKRAPLTLSKKTRDVDVVAVKPLTWRDAAPRQRRRRVGAGARAKRGGNHMTLFHFSPPSSLLASVMGGALHRGHASFVSLGDGAKRKRCKSKKSSNKKRPSSGEISTWTSRGQSPAAPYVRYPMNTETARLSLSQALRHFFSKEPVEQTKPGAGRGSRQHGKPRFKITSSTSRKRNSSAKSAAFLKTHKKNAASSYCQNAGSVFLKHLNFRPIQDSSNQSSGTSCESPQLPSADVNYKDWMNVNASLASSLSSNEDVELSSEDAHEQILCKESPPPNQKPNSILGKNFKTEKINNLDSESLREPLSIEEASQTSNLDFQPGNMLGYSHEKANNPLLHGTVKESVVTDPQTRVLDQFARSADKCDVDNHEDDIDMDDVADREMREMMCEESSESLKMLSQTAGGNGSAKCLTPHVSCAGSERAAPRVCCSSDCHSGTGGGRLVRGEHKSSSSVSKSNSSSDTNSGMSHHLALDEISKERVEQEFDLRLGRYMSLLCGEHASSPASRRLQARLLKYKRRLNLFNRTASQSSRSHQNVNTDAVSKPPLPVYADTANLGSIAAPVCTSLSPVDTAANGQDYQQENYSFNKKEDHLAFTFTCGTKPLPSRRPHSSPAKDTGLACPTKRGPTPSLRYLLQCAISTHINQSKHKQTSTTQEDNAFESAQERSSVDNSVVALCDEKTSNRKEEVNKCKPPAWRAVGQTARSAQTDGTGCACSCLAKSKTVSASAKTHRVPGRAASAQKAINTFSSARSGNGDDWYKPPISHAAKQERLPVKTLPHDESSFSQKIMTKSYTDPDFTKDSPPCCASKGCHQKQQAEASTGNASNSGSPGTYKKGEFTNEVTSKVEADLQRYNAVMNRCRALLSEHDPEEEDSSTWTQSSSIATFQSQSKMKIDGRVGDHTLPLPELSKAQLPNAKSESANQSMGDRTAETKDCRVEKLAVNPVKLSVEQSAPNNLKTCRKRPCSVDNVRGRSPIISHLPPKRSSSNPHYKGVVDFGSAEAIRRLVDPHICHAKPKVTFDIACDRSGASISSTCGYKQSEDDTRRPSSDKFRVPCLQRQKHTPSEEAQRNLAAPPSSLSRTKKGMPQNKKHNLPKASKRTLKSKLKTEETLRSIKECKLEDFSIAITPMRPRRPKTTNEPCTSRKPVRLNPYYNSTSGKKKSKKILLPVPRPCSQTSWKTVDTDGAAWSPSPEMIGSLARYDPSHKKKKTSRNVIEETSETCHQKLVKCVGKKNKKKTIRKAKPPAADVAETKEDHASPETNTASYARENNPLQHGDCVKNHPLPAQTSYANGVVSDTDNKTQKPTEKYGEVRLPGELNSSPTSLRPVDFADTSTNPNGKDATPDTNEMPTKSSEVHSASSQSVSSGSNPTKTEAASSPLKQSQSKPSPKRSPNRRRSTISEGKAAAPVKHPPTVSLSQPPKPFLCGKVTTRPALTKTAFKAHRYRSLGKRLSEKLPSDAPAEGKTSSGDPNPSEVTESDNTVQEARLEECRKAFITYKYSHPEVVESTLSAVAGSDGVRPSILRRCGPLVVAVLLQLLVQYAST